MEPLLLLGGAALLLYFGFGGKKAQSAPDVPKSCPAGQYSQIMSDGTLECVEHLGGDEPAPANIPVIPPDQKVPKGGLGANVTMTIRRAQVILLALGYKLPVYGADGSYGNETRLALTAFQANEGIAQSGYVDVATEGYLRMRAKGTVAELDFDMENQQEADEFVKKEVGFEDMGDLIAAGMFGDDGASYDMSLPGASDSAELTSGTAFAGVTGESLLGRVFGGDRVGARNRVLAARVGAGERPIRLREDRSKPIRMREEKPIRLRKLTPKEEEELQNQLAQLTY